jgi:alkyl hydroperoxide reductase subunit AhpC
MPGYEAALDEFSGCDAQVVGISVDSVFSHIAWQRSLGGLSYPLASDFYPQGAVARAYGVYREGPPIPGISERAIFIVNKAGNIAFSHVYDLSTQPENEELFEALQGIKQAEQQAKGAGGS